MRKRILASILTICLLITLLPASAVAVEDGNVVETEGILIGATGSLNAGDRKPEFSKDVFYKIVKNEDEDGYTLTFWSDSGNGVIPDYYIESQGTAYDGYEYQKKDVVTPTDEDKEAYPNGYVLDSNGNKHKVVTAADDPYVYCTSNVAHYSKTPWNLSEYKNEITKVVFEGSIAAIGRYTLFNMASVTSIEVQNEECALSNNMLYYNGVSGNACEFEVASTAYNEKCIGLYNTGESNVNFRITDAEEFMDQYRALLELDAENLTEKDKAAIQEAYQTYQEANEVFKNAVNAAEVGNTTFSEALKALVTTTGGTTGKVAVSGVYPGDTTEKIHYVITTEDDQTYTLRFYADEGSDGVMPVLALSAASAEEGQTAYNSTEWYKNYRTKITHVIYDESITKTGIYSAAHLVNCESIEFLNPTVNIVSSTVNYHLGQNVPEILHLYTTATTAKNWYGDFNNNEEAQARVTVSYYEAEKFEETYAAFFAKDNNSIEIDEAQNVKAAFDVLPAVCKAQLSTDVIPGTATTYVEKLNDLAEAGIIGGGYDPSVVESKVVPHAEDTDVTVQYEIKQNGDGTYTVRFYDPTGDGIMPSYAVTKAGEEHTWSSYEVLPWRVSPYDKQVTQIIFDSTISYIGQFVAANMDGCTDYQVLSPKTEFHKNAIYFNQDIDINDTGVTIHAYETSGVTYTCRPDIVSPEKAALIKISYYEAENFEESSEYAALWTMEETAAKENTVLIQKAYQEYSTFASDVQTQLGTDTIGDTEKTYADKLTELMAALDLGGDLNGISYVLSLNNDSETYTLTISGTGTVPANAPWENNTSITKVVINDGVTGIANGAFSGLTNLETVDVAESVTEIAEGAFPSDAKFELYGWLNHASGKYAETHDNVQLKLKELRILNMGNSHTGDYTAWLGNVLKDLDSQVETDITYTISPTAGGRRLYYWPTAGKPDDRGSHYYAVTTENDPTNQENIAKYKAVFEKTWDLVVVQDWHESTGASEGDYPGGAEYAKAIQEVVKWLNEDAPGAKIAWFADWADKSMNQGDLAFTYAQSVAAMKAVSELTENKPDFIIPASTVLQNARTSYLGETYNPHDVLINNWNEATNTWNFSDCATTNMDQYTVLERDATHMSLELGRQLMASAFMYSVFQKYKNEMITSEGFDFFDCLETAPEYVNSKDTTCTWQGEFTDEHWAIIEESCEHAWETPLAVTSCSAQYQTDPFQEKYETVQTVLKTVEKPPVLSDETLTAAYTSEDVVKALQETGLNIQTSDIHVTYVAPVDGTEEDPTGTAGSYTVTVDCHYGYSYPTEAALKETLPAVPYGDVSAELAAAKEKAIAKLDSYMSDDSYGEESGARATVAAAKEDGKKAINAATTVAEVIAARNAAEAEIDKVPTLFALAHQPDADIVECGQIWTGGWNITTGEIEKNYYTLDYNSSKGEIDSTFTGVWWVIKRNGNDGYIVEFSKDYGTDYTFETPAYNATHWLDQDRTEKSYNPLQYSHTPWMTGYKNTLTKAIVDPGVTINQHALACYPNIKEYVIEDGAALGTNAIYFNPLMTDTKVTFEGSAVVQKDAFSAYRVQNSYDYYVDVEGDMSKVHIGSAEGDTLEKNLYQAFGVYKEAQSWNVEAQDYDTIWVGLAGTDINETKDFAPHYTNDVPDGTTMLRVTNTSQTHSHEIGAENVALVSGYTADRPCETGLKDGYVCLTCGAVVVAQEVIPATEKHTWDSGEVTIEATDTEKGLITYTCQVCGATKTEEIDRLLSKDPVAAMDGKNYATLQAAINAAGTNAANIHLLKDVKEDVTIAAGQTIILDLNGKTLTDVTNENSDTISNYGNLTIADSAGNGTVDNVTPGMGALVNYPSSTVILDGGTFTRSEESGKTNSWYTVKNLGQMTINEDVTVTTGTGSTGASSLIANGWYYGNKDPNDTSVDRKTAHEGNTVAELTINGGNFSGGMNTVKNDDWGVLVIKDGTFENTTGPVILNWNETTVEGGNFKATKDIVVANGYTNDTSDKGKFTINGGTFISGNDGKSPLFGTGESSTKGGELSITGGEFTGEVSGAAYYEVAISDGTFSTEVPNDYCAEGFVPTEKDEDGKYTVCQGWIITLDYQDNITPGGSIAVKKGEKANLPTPEREGYTFDGWFTEGGTLYTSETDITSDVTLYAHWTESQGTHTHTYGTPTFTWAADNTCTAKATCTDGDNTVTKTCTVTSVTSGRTTTYTATVEIGGKTYTDTKTVTASGGGSSSGSGSSSSTYSITVDSGKHGDAAVNTKNAKQGATVTITVKPDDGYALDSLTVTDKNGKTIKVTEGKNGKFTFTMPASKVTVEAVFTESEQTAERRFTDVPEGFWAEDEINWAAENGYMNGNTATTFNPNGIVTRQQLWMILARLSGQRPADFAAAKAWAVANGVSDGTNPGNAVSRQQLVTILYRYAALMGYKTSGTADLTVFPDHASVAAYAKDAMSWSVANNIVGGTAQGTLNPTGTATRAQFAVILYRFCENIVK